MNLIERLKELHKAEHNEGEHGGDAFCAWADASAMAWPKLLAVVEAAKKYKAYLGFNKEEDALRALFNALAALEDK